MENPIKLQKYACKFELVSSTNICGKFQLNWSLDTQKKIAQHFCTYINFCYVKKN